MSRYLPEDLDDPALQAACGYVPPMPDDPELLPLGKGILAYTVHVRGVARVAQFAVVFRGEATSESRGMAIGRLQWFISSVVGPGELRDMSTDDAVPAELPVDTLIFTSELDGEGFWFGPSPTDEALVRRSLGLPKMLGWGWSRDDRMNVNLMGTARGET